MRPKKYKPSKLVRINPIVINHIKTIAKTGESFDATLTRVLGLRVDQDNVIKNQISRMPEVTEYIDHEIHNYVKQGLIKWDSPYTEFYDPIKEEMEINDYKKIYPQLFTKTRNGQFRLAHIVRSRVKRYRDIRVK